MEDPDGTPTAEGEPEPVETIPFEDEQVVTIKVDTSELAAVDERARALRMKLQLTQVKK